MPYRATIPAIVLPDFPLGVCQYFGCFEISFFLIDFIRDVPDVAHTGGRAIDGEHAFQKASLLDIIDTQLSAERTKGGTESHTH
jgi:hypothetical protein